MCGRAEDTKYHIDAESFFLFAIQMFGNGAQGRGHLLGLQLQQLSRLHHSNAGLLTCCVTLKSCSSGPKQETECWQRDKRGKNGLVSVSEDYFVFGATEKRRQDVKATGEKSVELQIHVHKSSNKDRKQKMAQM